MDPMAFSLSIILSKALESEREAVLAALREGMVWINLKLSNTIIV
ncbi:hypothetical protein AWB68_07177 [Caballeronia choica]|jgi:hypothetical protein|uniref:Uncharacterized protein n=1 Tax=Caballeronia choica TaxID=326476 RepID=A0A158KSL8_9BURK|nr:hypothetical protein AWB68_07177 [Caballeronia choica]